MVRAYTDAGSTPESMRMRAQSLCGGDEQLFDNLSAMSKREIPKLLMVGRPSPSAMAANQRRLAIH